MAIDPPVPTRSPLALVVLLASLLIIPAPLPAQESPEERGLAIFREAETRDEGFGDFTAALEMVLRTGPGQESKRQMRIRTLEVLEDGDKSLVIFDEPRDVKGTALLTFSYKTGDDDQWLYLPALERVKRISSSNQSGPFMGSEFAYEDLSSQEVEKYTYNYLREEELNGVACHVIERTPLHPKSGYRRQVVWLDQEHLRVLKIDFFDRKDSLLKTLTQSGFEQFLDRHWRPASQQMVNHQNGKTTELIWTDYAFQTGLDDGDFNRTSLARTR